MRSGILELSISSFIICVKTLVIKQKKGGARKRKKVSDEDWTRAKKGEHVNIQ